MDRRFPIITLLLGFFTATMKDYINDLIGTKTKKTDRRAEFQRNTLLELQETLHRVARATAESYHKDSMAYRETGKRLAQVPEELNQRLQESIMRTRILQVRVEDETLRNLVDRVIDASTKATVMPLREENIQGMRELLTTFKSANDRLGERLRGTY
jgi:hypothetical protein